MIQPIRQTVLILSGEEQLPFDPAELKNGLVRCFLYAGLDDLCYLAGDITLAVEYALEHAERAPAVFSRAELDDMVIRILENTGYGEVARIYRRGAPSRARTVCSAEAGTVTGILKRYFTGSEEHLAGLTQQVTGALAALHIRETAPELMVELARHFESSVPAEPLPLPVKARRTDEQYLLSPEEIRTALPEGIPGIGKAARLHGVSRLFPSIRITFSLRQYAVLQAWDAPLLELTLQPELAAAGKAVAAGRDRILQLYREVTGNPENQLPFYLRVPDMDDFLGEYLQCAPGGLPSLRREVGGMLSAGIPGPMEKLHFA